MSHGLSKCVRDARRVRAESNLKPPEGNVSEGTKSQQGLSLVAFVLAVVVVRWNRVRQINHEMDSLRSRAFALPMCMCVFCPSYTVQTLRWSCRTQGRIFYLSPSLYSGLVQCVRLDGAWYSAGTVNNPGNHLPVPGVISPQAHRFSTQGYCKPDVLRNKRKRSSQVFFSCKRNWSTC